MMKALFRFTSRMVSVFIIVSMLISFYNGEYAKILVYGVMFGSVELCSLNATLSEISDKLDEEVIEDELI